MQDVDPACATDRDQSRFDGRFACSSSPAVEETKTAETLRRPSCILRLDCEYVLLLRISGDQLDLVSSSSC